MTGHYGVRAALKAMFEQVLPERLDLLRAEPDMAWLPNPDYVQLVDDIPEDDARCRVLVSSAESSQVAATGASGYDARQYDYRIVVGVVVNTTGEDPDPERCSVLRDQTILAVREALLTRGQLTEDIAIVRGSSTREETGTGQQDVMGRTVSIGSIEVTVRATETVATTDPVLAQASTTTAPLT